MADLRTNAAEFTVSELALAVKRTVEERFEFVRVRGEISGFRGRHASGHAYFTLKDDSACIDAVIWKTTWPRLMFKPEEGLEVIATGRLTTYPRSSKYQIVIEQLQPAGAGALMALIEERRKRLAAEGLFAAERKRRLPYLPRRIGVVTSPTGAVIRDILHRLADRFPTDVLVWPVRVQGETSAAEIAAAIAGFNALPASGPAPRPDLLIVARGGGSIEDLWGFNDEAVVRAVVASRIPVISAVGHETDTTLIDYAADLRAPTPTAAAEAAVPVRAELVGHVDTLGARLRQGARRVSANRRDRLRALAAGLPRPADLVGASRQRVDLAATNLGAALRHLAQKKALAFARQAPRLTARLLGRRTRLNVERLRHIGERMAGAAARPVAHGRLRLAAPARELAPAMVRIVAAREQRLSQSARLLETVSYRNVLDRGFALVTDADGRLVRAKAGLRLGDALGIEFADGRVGAVVAGANPAPLRRPRVRARNKEDQPELF